MKTGILIFFFALIILNCFGANPVSMKVVTTKGDTINGTTFYILKKQNPEVINFRSSDGGTYNYKPKDIKSFKTEDDYFISDSVNLDMKYARSLEISTNFSDKIVKDTLVFLRVLVKGKLSLFLLRDINGKDHFFVNDGNGYLELINKIVGSYTFDRSKVNQSNEDSVPRRSTYYDSRYKDQLKSLMPEFINDTVRINKTKFDENELTRLLSDYNKKASPINFNYSQKIYNSISNYLFIGALISKVKFTAIDFFTHTEDIGSATSSVTPAIGFSIPIQLRRRSNFLNLVPEIMIRVYDFKCDYSRGYISRHAHFGELQMKGNVAFQSEFKINKTVGLFLNAGFTLSMMIHSVNSLESYNNDPQFNTYYSRETKGQIFAHIRPGDNGYFISAGTIFKKFMMQIRYEHIFTGIEFNGQYNFYYFLIGYQVR